jgi:rRNA maturation endonuclease Nob1
MGDEATVNVLMRHLQAELVATDTIADAVERQQRQRQLQAALQEVMRFVAVHDERIRLGLDPTVTVRPAQRTVESEVRETMSTMAAGICESCNAMLDPELDFCPACGAR